MVYKFLTQDFFNDYPYGLFPEIEYKADRPYAVVTVTVNGHTFALPLRSHIVHKHSYLTDRKNKCGIDFSKAVYISKDSYLDNARQPYIRQNEYDFLKGKDYIVQQKFIKYISDYVKAMKSNDANKMRSFKYSTLGYFENIIDYENDILNKQTSSDKEPVKV